MGSVSIILGMIMIIMIVGIIQFFIVQSMYNAIGVPIYSKSVPYNLPDNVKFDNINANHITIGEWKLSSSADTTSLQPNGNSLLFKSGDSALEIGDTQTITCPAIYSGDVNTWKIRISEGFASRGFHSSVGLNTFFSSVISIGVVTAKDINTTTAMVGNHIGTKILRATNIINGGLTNPVTIRELEILKAKSAAAYIAALEAATLQAELDRLNAAAREQGLKIIYKRNT